MTNLSIFSLLGGHKILLILPILNLTCLTCLPCLTCLKWELNRPFIIHYCTSLACLTFLICLHCLTCLSSLYREGPIGHPYIIIQVLLILPILNLSCLTSLPCLTCLKQKLIPQFIILYRTSIVCPLLLICLPCLTSLSSLYREGSISHPYIIIQVLLILAIVNQSSLTYLTCLTCLEREGSVGHLSYSIL